jgi:hypothetical protein
MEFAQPKLCMLCEKMLAGDWGPDSTIKPSGDPEAAEVFHARSPYPEPFKQFVITPDPVNGLSRAYVTYPHHDFTSLQNSAEAGCYLCLRFWFSERERRRGEREGSGKEEIDEAVAQRACIEMSFSRSDHLGLRWSVIGADHSMDFIGLWPIRRELLSLKTSSASS